MFPVKKKKRISRGSVAVFALFLMFILVIATIGIITTAAIERKVSISTGNSTTAFQVAESGMEKTLQYFKSNFDKTLSDIGSCSSGIVTYSSNNTVRFKDNAATPAYITNCGESISNVKIIKSIGTTKQETRAIEEDVFLGLTKLLLHLDGPIDSGEFTDSSFYYNNHPIDDHGSLRASTKDATTPSNSEPYKFGASTYFDGDDTDESYLSVPDSNDWDFGTGDFTVDFWVRLEEAQPNNNKRTYIDIGSDSVTLFKIRQENSNKLCVYSMEFEHCWDIDVMEESGVGDNDMMYHIAVIRKADENKIKLFIDGEQQGLAELFNEDIQEGSDLGDEAVRIGASQDSSDRLFKGFMEELRISKGVARWWEDDFNPPIAQYWPD
ncbi:hypothetical protein KJ761_01235 [Patescibacteria group bacterium]|nr:hypothetical protein [Patescibacteria group bacterium]